MSGHESRQGLNDGDLEAVCAQGHRGIQPQKAAAQYDGAPDLPALLPQGQGITHRAQRVDPREIRSRNRWHPGMRARCQDELIIPVGSAVIEDYLVRLRPDVYDAAREDRTDATLLVPLSWIEGHLFRRRLASKQVDEPGAGVVGVALVRVDGNRDGRIPA